MIRTVLMQTITCRSREKDRCPARSPASEGLQLFRADPFPLSLTLVTSGDWLKAQGHKGMRGMQQVDNKVMYMILGFFLPIVLIPIVQDEINRLQPTA